jgi:hypothetical protein
MSEGQKELIKKFRALGYSGPFSGGEWSKSCIVEDILNKTHEFSFNAFMDLVDLFGWENPPIDSLKTPSKSFCREKYRFFASLRMTCGDEFETAWGFSG